jgi:hypothetical protein
MREIQWHAFQVMFPLLPADTVNSVHTLKAVANEPWSGHYEITSPTWALAHTTQFSKPGWRYTQHSNGVDVLSSGGSIVTRVSPDGADFSVVIEKMSTSNSQCARGSNPAVSTYPEVVKMTLKGESLAARLGYTSIVHELDILTVQCIMSRTAAGALLAAAKSKGLTVWWSNLGDNNNLGSNPPDNQVFQKQINPLVVAADGTVILR